MGKTHDLAAKEEQVQPDLSLKMESDLEEVLRNGRTPTLASGAVRLVLQPPTAL